MKKLLSFLFISLFALGSIFGQAVGKQISNKASGGTITTDSINAYTNFNINQTTAGQTIIIGSPTNPKIINLSNIGTTDVFLSPGGVLPIGGMVTMRWTGATWSVTYLDKSEPIGEVYTETWADLSDWTSVGTPTATVSGNKLSLGGVSSISTNYIRCSGYGNTNAEYAYFEWQEIIGTIGASTSGKPFGLQSQSADFARSLQVNVELSTTNTGRIRWYYNNSATVIQNSNSDISGLIAGDTIHFRLWRFPDRMMVVAGEKGTTPVTDVLYYSYPRTLQTAINPPLAGQFAFFTLGGTHTIRDFHFKILDLKNSDYLWIGNSITQATGSNTRVLAEIQKRYKEIVQCNGAPGAVCADINVSEIDFYNPTKIILWIGTNDISFTNLAAAQTAFGNLVTSLSGIGYSIANGNLKIANCLPRSHADYNTFNTWLVTTYGWANILNMNGVVSDGTTTFQTAYSADLVHPNGPGCEILAVYTGEFLGLTKNNNFYDNRFVTIHPYLNTVSLPKTTFTAGTLTDGTNAFALTATMPTTITAINNAIDITVTSAGSSAFSNRAGLITYAAGYTGSSATICLQGINSVAGTGTNLLAGTHNSGLVGSCNATTTGAGVGLKGVGSNADKSIGVVGFGVTAKNNGINGGGVFIGRNTGTTPIQFGVYAGLNSTDPTFASAALIADNSDQTSPIALFRDNGSNVFAINDGGSLTILATNTTGGTTGDQVINKPSGTVNIAAAGTTVTVTNSLVTTSSIVFAVVRTNDTTAVIKNVVPGSGSFVINLSAAATAETSIGFFVIN
jgi:hypothetical protein